MPPSHLIRRQKKNRYGGWRYGPDATDADASVSGATMVGLLAARDAGVEVPDDAIDRGVAYFKSMTSPSGQVAYSGLGGFDDSVARISIGTLVYAVARRKDMPEFKSTLLSLTSRLEQASGNFATCRNLSACGSDIAGSGLEVAHRATVRLTAKFQRGN